MRVLLLYPSLPCRAGFCGISASSFVGSSATSLTKQPTLVVTLPLLTVYDTGLRSGGGLLTNWGPRAGSNVGQL